ncbi:MAG: hydroxyethylthiazole kinase [Eubacteriales bacterium]|nr:hydroxyethylthiazole kinase [Eubacteriales bacterium]
MQAENMRRLWKEVAARRPLIHCLTNVITVESCANAILGLGATPVMAHHIEEVAEITAHSRALLCNLGATEYMEQMKCSAVVAAAEGIPLVLDPVGVGSSGFRRKFCLDQLSRWRPTVIRGNASEMRALYENRRTANGVDAEPCVTAVGDRPCDQGQCDPSTEILKELCQMAAEMARLWQTMIMISGPTDVISDGERTVLIHNDCPALTRITGAGCIESAVIAAFMGVEQSLEALLTASVLMVVCAERADDLTKRSGGGQQTFYQALLDQLSLPTACDLFANAVIEWV